VTAELRQLRDKPFDLMLALDARLQAGAQSATGDTTHVWIGLGFRLGEHYLVAPRDDVREVLSTPEYTRVPGAKPWLLGIANVRGDLLPIIDLNRFLGGDAPPGQRGSRVLVYNSPDVPAGFMVDEVPGFRRFQPQDQRHEMAPEGGALSPYLLGAFVREGQLWAAFSLSKLVTSPAFQNAGS
jgi:twitching motility protein PilI